MAAGEAGDQPRVERGRAYVLHGFEVGQLIYLDESERRITSSTERARIQHKHRVPATSSTFPRRCGCCRSRLRSLSVRTRYGAGRGRYDFGAASITYSVPLQGRRANLVELSAVLSDDETLRGESRTTGTPPSCASSKRWRAAT